jgi:chromosome segregation ATPase
LNLGQAQATAYYGEYLKIVGLDNITKIYQELQSGVWYFVKLCKEAKAAKMGIPEVINLLRIANNNLPSVQRRYNGLQKENNILEPIITDKSMEVQNLNSQIRDKRESLEAIKSECRGEAALLEGLRQQTAKVETFVYNYKNNNEDYVKLIKSIENKVHDFLLDKKKFLNTAIISLIESMRNDPEKYSALVYHNNDKQNSSSSRSEGHNSNLLNVSRHVAVLPPPPYDNYMIEYYKDIMLKEAEKLYNDIVDQILCVVNENVAKQSVETMPSSLPALPLEEGGEADDDKQN